MTPHFFSRRVPTPLPLTHSAPASSDLDLMYMTQTELCDLKRMGGIWSKTELNLWPGTKPLTASI